MDAPRRTPAHAMTTICDSPVRPMRGPSIASRFDSMRRFERVQLHVTIAVAISSVVAMTIVICMTTHLLD